MPKGAGSFRQNAETFFCDADCDGSGCLSRTELWKVLINLGFKDMSAEEVNTIFDDINPNRDDKVSKQEFFAALEKMPPSKVVDADLERVFNAFDTDNTGYLTREEVKAAMSGAGYDCEVCLSSIDDNGDGKISIVEFKDMFKSSCN